MEGFMDRATAREIIFTVVEHTKKWQDKNRDFWPNLDRLFIEKGYEQQGFECHKFIRLLEKRNIWSIQALGKILSRPPSVSPSYEDNFAGSLQKPFYRDLSEGVRGLEGQQFYNSVKEFEEKKVGRTGRFYFKELWHMLVGCQYLYQNYDASFKKYLYLKVAEHMRVPNVTDDDVLQLDGTQWQSFKSAKSPWSPLRGIGENTFDYIFGDFDEAAFSRDTFKLDSANEYFLSITGIDTLIPNIDRDGIITFLRSLDLPYSLREINRGLYAYCSKTEASHFGFCRSPARCNPCRVNDLCGKHFDRATALAKKVTGKRRSDRASSLSTPTPPSSPTGPVRPVSQHPIVHELRSILASVGISDPIEVDQYWGGKSYIALKHSQKKSFFVFYYRRSLLEVFPTRTLTPQKILAEYGIKGKGDTEEYSSYPSKRYYSLLIPINPKSPSGRYINDRYTFTEKAEFFKRVALDKIAKRGNRE
jgi:hypothetical protein